MRRKILAILVVLSISSVAQKNEIITLPGITTNHFYLDQSAVFQFKYERAIGRSISIQTGLRYHNEIQQNTMDGISKWIQSSLNSHKLDATFVIIPINKDRFKLKTGLGFDIGFSQYYWSWWGVTIPQPTEDGYKYFTYWQYNIDKLPDYGMHFILQGNYYFKNNLFVTTQILYNNVFDAEVANTKYSKTLYRNSPLCLSAGLGYKL